MKRLLITILLVKIFATILSHANSPYSPTQVGTSENGSQIGLYSYNTAGNRLSKKVNNVAVQTITMGLITKPETITTGDKDPEIFKYGVGSRRYMRVHADGRKTFYLNGMEYRLPTPDTSDTATSIVQIHAKGYSPDVQVDVTDVSSPEYTYLAKDHLGSPVVTVDDAGNAQNPSRFDPWGKIIAATGVEKDLSNPNDAQELEKNRGYTGHETIASMNLIHMNGRVYDPQIGSMLGPDRFIQGRSIAALNRFSLGQNRNPNIIDPSGWIQAPAEFIFPEGHLLNQDGRRLLEAQVTRLHQNLTLPEGIEESRIQRVTYTHNRGRSSLVWEPRSAMSYHRYAEAFDVSIELRSGLTLTSEDGQAFRYVHPRQGVSRNSLTSILNNMRPQIAEEVARVDRVESLILKGVLILHGSRYAGVFDGVSTAQDVNEMRATIRRARPPELDNVQRQISSRAYELRAARWLEVDGLRTTSERFYDLFHDGHLPYSRSRLRSVRVYLELVELESDTADVARRRINSQMAPFWPDEMFE